MNLSFDAIRARNFIDHCKTKFGWTDLSKDVIMDLGCGEDAICGRSILEKFPDVRSIIAIDKDRAVMNKVKSNHNEKIHCDLGDIEKRSSLEYYESKMTKVVSTCMLHDLMDQRTVFENIYNLLQPGGEAAILFFLHSPARDLIKEILKKPKWKEFFQSPFVDNVLEESGQLSYQEMVKKIGFQIVDCSEDQRSHQVLSDIGRREEMYQFVRNFFKVPSEFVDEFQEDYFQNYSRAFGIKEKGQSCKKLKLLSLLLVKPTENSSKPE